jgi:hypothetical protein
LGIGQNHDTNILSLIQDIGSIYGKYYYANEKNSTNVIEDIQIGTKKMF